MIRHAMDIWYEEVKAATAKESIALNATVEPMLISESNTVKARDMSTALKGMFQPGLTCKEI
jgi:hypothetical protein